MMPECALQNIAHPHRNPTGVATVSLRKTYTPPVCGKTDDSSAQTSEPSSVSTPATPQTESTPAKVGTCRLISEGCTKMDAPMMMPTTMALACRSPMGRSRGADLWGEAKGECIRTESTTAPSGRGSECGFLRSGDPKE